MSEQIRREFTLPYPIQKVTTAIEDACRTSGAKLIITTRNQTFNSYTINILKGVYVLPTTITLRPEGDKTIFDLSAIPGNNLSKMPSVTTSAIDGLLNRIGDFAAGRLVVGPPSQQDIEKQRKDGRNILILVVLAIAFIVIVFYYALK